MDSWALSFEEASVMAALDVATAYIVSLTKRAEAAEAKLRDVAYWHEAWKEAEAEREALRQDVARLDWMESQKVLRASFYPLCFPPCWVVEASEVTSGETLRVAIDAAMAVQP
jgi:histidinol-phosphate/aromatic aminotransferase/cobyric acid decarboxylase-like protein